MKIIDLLNKIANGEETHFEKKLNGKVVIVNYYNDRDFSSSTDPEMLTIADIIKSLNDEVEILEEEKKIPEKLPYYSLEKIQKAKNKDEWREERISLLEKRVNDLHIKMNDLLDYLKSKGE